MSQRIAFGRQIALVVTILIPLVAFAGEPVGHPSGGGAAIEWSANISGHDHVRLTVAAPDGEVYTKTFRAGQPMSFRVQDLGAGVADGVYNYELIVGPRVPPGVARQLENARVVNDEKAAKKIRHDNGLDNAVIQSGSFTVLNGSIVSPSLQESTGKPSVSAHPQSDTTSSGQASGNGRNPGDVTALDQVIPDDLIVQGSACIGLDCVNNETFSFDTIRMKENNTRVKFEDTSATTFPTTDWQLTANESASGGQNKFSIEDVTSAKIPFTVEGGSPTNSVYIDSTGRVGFRTSTPVLDLHAATSDTPAIRLEQNSAGGFTAQTWDIAGNEANFFVRDVTGGSRLPFRIRPGAPTSSIDINAVGRVGIGTASPAEKVHVFESADANTLLSVENSGLGLMSAGVLRSKSDSATSNFQSHGSGRTLSRFGQTLASWNEMLAVSGNGLIIGTLGAKPLIFGTNNAARLTISDTGAVTIPGNLTVSGVKNFAVEDPADSSRAIYFTALEGPEAGTYFRGTAKTVNGEAVVVLPGYFARLTENERMTVQLTPVGSWGQLYVAGKSPEKLVIRIAEGGVDLEFDYLVQGVRKGYLDYKVERTGVFPVK
ncbi:MAG: hypothetical protein JJE51_04920 [Thermoanaerobaculia bacterium]|nr:hypothetical protein [Thermoanaerobaculia bacterium]